MSTILILNTLNTRGSSTHLSLWFYRNIFWYFSWKLLQWFRSYEEIHLCKSLLFKTVLSLSPSVRHIARLQAYAKTIAALFLRNMLVIIKTKIITSLPKISCCCNENISLDDWNLDTQSIYVVHKRNSKLKK
jgi:hypothetical protein